MSARASSETRVAEMLAILAAVPLGLALREVLLLLEILIEASTVPHHLERAVRDAAEPVLRRGVP